MRILLTGATGFLGSHLFSRLLKEQVEIGIIKRGESRSWRIDPIPPKVRIIPGDLRAFENLQQAVANFGADTLIHAAWAGVMNRQRNEPAQIEQNVLPTVQLLQTALNSGCRNFIGLGSQAEYGPLNKLISETEATRPTTIYGAAKLATSILAEQLCAQAGARFAWVRVFSTYGPMEDPDWMIPYVIRKFLAGEKPSLTACEQRWDFLHAEDAAEALWSLAKTRAAGVFNLGSGQVYTLRQVVEQIRNRINPALPIGFGEVPYRADQVMHLQADISKLTRATGWKPASSLESGLADDIAWHRAQQAKPS